MIKINGKEVKGFSAVMAEIFAGLVSFWAISLAFGFIILIFVLLFIPLWLPILLAFLVGRAL